MTMTRSSIKEQVMKKSTPKPKEKPMTPSERKKMAATVARGNASSKLEGDSFKALKKDQKNRKVASKGTKKKPNNYKCGGKIKKQK